MPLSPTTLTTNEQLHTVEKVINGKGNNQIKKASPLAYALMGMNEDFVTPIPKRIGRTVPLLAGYLEMHFITDAKAITPVMDNTDALSLVTPAAYSPAQAVRVKGTLYADIAWISKLDLLAAEGASPQKSQDFIERQVDALIASAEKELATALYSDNEQSRTTLSGLKYWLDDDNTIGIDGFTHTRSAGGVLASNMDEVSEALSELKYYKNKTKNAVKGGKNDLTLGDSTAIPQLWNLLKAKDQVILDDKKWANYGADYFRHGHTVIAPDDYCTANYLYTVDLKSLRFGMNPEGLNVGKFTDYHGVRAGKAASWGFAAVLACDDPRKCGVINTFT